MNKPIVAYRAGDRKVACTVFIGILFVRVSLPKPVFGDTRFSESSCIPSRPDGASFFAAPSQVYQVREDKLGKTTTCKKCDKPFVLQVLEQQPAAPQVNSLYERLLLDPKKTGVRATAVGATAILISAMCKWLIAPFGIGVGLRGNDPLIVAALGIGILWIVFLQSKSGAIWQSRTICGLSAIAFWFPACLVYRMNNQDGGELVAFGLGFWLAAGGAIASGAGQLLISQADLMTPIGADGKPRSLGQSLGQVVERLKGTGAAPIQAKRPLPQS